MKLYYSPGACSLAAHIVLRETGSKFETEKVDLGYQAHLDRGGLYPNKSKGLRSRARARQRARCSPRSGTVIQYLADQKKELNLVP
jgi:glutathione S-transferase